jgi:hypothetical protein
MEEGRDRERRETGGRTKRMRRWEEKPGNPGLGLPSIILSEREKERERERNADNLCLDARRPSLHLPSAAWTSATPPHSAGFGLRGL